MEEIILNILRHSGEARNYSMEAITLAKAGEFTTAKELIDVHKRIKAIN